MRWILPAVLVLLTCCSCEQEVEKTASEQPNIILIMTDDQGFGDLGFHGNPDIQTPVLDAFAKESIRLTNFYVSPVCAPTRAALMTGRYSLRTGVMDTYNGWARMATEEETLAEVLKEHGYATAISGKWHLGDNFPSRAMDQGFDYSLTHSAGGMAQVGDPDTWFKGDSAYFNPVLRENGVKVKKKGYCSDVFTDAVIDFISEKKDQPFFAYLAFNAPHTPLQLPEKYADMYADMQVDTTRYAVHERNFKQLNDQELNAARKVYGMVSNIDDNIGRILNKLEALNLKDHTIVIFMTDNGPQQRRYVGGLRGLKGSVYEGGIHVPFFIRYPEKWAADKEVDVLAAHVDLLPTLLDACQINRPTGLDGKSLKPLLEGRDVDWSESRKIYFDWNRGFPERYHNIAVRQGDFKLVGQTGYNAQAADFELYNIKDDPSELHDVSTDHMPLVQELKNSFDLWYGEMISSPYLDNVPIVIGSDQENPSLLSRNDAKGSWGVWAQKEIYGYWDVASAQDARYDVNCFFEEPLAYRGVMRMRIGRQQLMQEVAAGQQNIVFKQVAIKKGKFKVEAGFRNYENWRVAFPFYVEMEKK